MDSSSSASRYPGWASLAKSALGAALVLAALTSGEAQAFGVVVNVDGEDWDVTTFTGSYNDNISKFAQPPGQGVMPWWGVWMSDSSGPIPTLAIKFATAVGSQLCSSANYGVYGPFFGWRFGLDGIGLIADAGSAAFYDSGISGVAGTSAQFGDTQPLTWAQASLIHDVAGAPGPLPAFGAATAFGFSRKLRKRIKSIANPITSSFTI